MRLLLVGLGLAGMLACDPYADVARTDTVEAYEAYLAANPDGANAFRARVRLEELVFQRAKAERTPEAWDAYLTRFPDGAFVETAQRQREEDLFAWADAQATATAWQRFLDAYPKAKRGRDKKAQEGLEATTYAVHMPQSEPRISKVNLAEDPEGPLDGMQFDVDVTNQGDKTVVSYWLRVHYLDAAGESLDAREWPLVAPYREFPVPVEEALTVPMAPGDTRTWSWMAGEFPERFAGKVRVVPFKIRFADEG